MATVTLECEVTEYECEVPEANEINLFVISKNSLIINFCESNESILQQSEISKDDAIELARFIFFKYNIKL